MPKVEETTIIKEFIPISLIGCVYKLIAKVSTRRMAKMKNRMVGRCQIAFMEDKHIFNVALVANKILDVLLNWRMFYAS